MTRARPSQTTRVDGTNNREIIAQHKSNTGVAIFGLGGADRIVGSAYSDFINGGTGADRMFGGKGNDTYIVDNVDDEIIEGGNDRYDAIYASVSYTLPHGVENLYLEYNAYSGTGNDQKNTIIGTNRDNQLRSGGGAGDWIRGYGGKDIIHGSRDNGTVNEELWGDAGDDTIHGNGGDDTLRGGFDHDKLYGGPGSDRLLGESGNDTLVGSSEASRAGNKEVDTLIGGGGADSFVLGVRGWWGTGRLLYDDSGVQDYAKITDFELGKDVLKLVSGYQYGISNAGRWGFQGTGITANIGGQDELLAVMTNVHHSNINEIRNSFSMI